MDKFRVENSYLVYYVNAFGLNLKSIESLTSNKFLLGFLAVWTKIPLIAVPIYVLFDLQFLIFGDAPLLVKFALARKITALGGASIKIIIFFFHRNWFEDLMDLWDELFQTDFYPEEYKIYKEKNLRSNKLLIRSCLILLATACFLYSVPEFFSKKKKLFHPSGIIFPHRSPEFEIVATYEVVVAFSAIAKVAFDSILMVFLSQVRCKLVFLRDALTHMINELIVDDQGRLMARQHTEENDENSIQLLPTNYIQEGEGFNVGHYNIIEPKSEHFNKKVEEFEAKLRIWILHHQQTIWFFEELKKTYSFVAGLELVYVTTYIGLTALYLVQVKPSPVLAGIVLVASSNLLTLFLWCKIGGEVGDTNVFSDAFGRAWFLYPKKIQTAFSLIAMRCRKPLTLNGISICSMNLVTFFEILKLAYELFAFMVQFTK